MLDIVESGAATQSRLAAELGVTPTTVAFHVSKARRERHLGKRSPLEVDLTEGLDESVKEMVSYIRTGRSARCQECRSLFDRLSSRSRKFCSSCAVKLADD